jgi:C-terminal processing protease CtpA/Prc
MTASLVQFGRIGVVLGALLSALLVLPSTASGQAANEPADQPPVEGERQVENLRAFAKLYGYVRYFHPSDAAADLDWEAFVVHGVQEVRDARSPSALRNRMQELFKPIAPTLQLYERGSDPGERSATLKPSDPTGLDVVAWQHLGIELNDRGPYRSIRLHRETDSNRGPHVGTVFQSVDAAPYRGREVRLRAAVRTAVQSGDDGANNHVKLGLRFSREGSNAGFFEIMTDRPITDSTWARYEVTGTVDENADQIVFGGFLRGSGAAYLDAFDLQVRDSTGSGWTRVPLRNAGFEQGTQSASPPGWVGYPDAYAFRTREGRAYDGEQYVAITSPTPQEAQALFEERPEPGETATRSLGRGLVADVPLALYSRDGRTLRPGDTPEPDDLHRSLNQVSLVRLTIDDEALRLANVIIAWNVLQHFYPYFGVVEVNWDRVLTQTLRRARADSSRTEFTQTLRRMLVPLRDGHGRVFDAETQRGAFLPLRFDRVEGEIVVADTVSPRDGAHCARPGDIVESVGGTAVSDAIEARKRLVSGSEQWREQRVLEVLGNGAPDTQVNLVFRREGEKVACSVPRADRANASRWRKRLQTEPRPDSIDVLPGGTHYVDLTRIDMNGLRPHLDSLADAEAIIFDVRGYPGTGHQELLQHLASDTLRSARFEIPQILYPDRQEIVGFREKRRTLPPKSPRITGQVVFLTDARALSYAETIMAVVEHYDLGTIVGQPTAGVNGNVNPLTLPGGYRILWTGMRVRKHDGSQHHLIGIRPDVSATRTIEGVRSGRDEVLERAQEVVR